MKTRIIILILILAGTTAGIVWRITSPNPSSRGGETGEVSGQLRDLISNSVSETRVATTTPTSTPPHEGEEGRGSGTGSKVKFSCTGEKASDFDCYDLYYAGLVKNQGIAAAFADLKIRYSQIAYVQSQCHPITHVIGYEASKKFKDVAEAYTQGDSFCWSGYYHGVLEGVIARIGYDNLVSQINGICAPLAAAAKYSFNHYNCVHGLGHGVMALEDDELFRSLSICDAVTDNWERVSCWSGAFMENVIVDNKYHNAKYLKPFDPLYPCDAAAEKYKETCYLMQTSYMLTVVGGNFSRVFELCGTAEEAHRNTCYQSLGRDASGRSSSNVGQTIAWCNLGADLNQRKNCAIGAVKDFISYFHSDTQAHQLCAAFTEQEVQDECTRTGDAYYKIF